MSESFYFAGSLILIFIFAFAIGKCSVSIQNTANDAPVDEELAKLEHDVALMRLKIEAQKLKEQLKI